jgi:hypothetical protein
VVLVEERDHLHVPDRGIRSVHHFGLQTLMILEDDIDVTHSSDLNNHHYFSYPQDADCLYFGLTSAGMGGSWKICTLLSTPGTATTTSISSGHADS